MKMEQYFLNYCINQNVTEHETKQSKAAGEARAVLRTLQVQIEQRRATATEITRFAFSRNIFS